MVVSYTSPYALVFAAATTITAVLAVYGWRRRSDAGVAFAAFMGTVTVWSAAQAVAVVTPPEGPRFLVERLKWVAIPSVPVTFLVFAARYAGYDRWVTVRRVGAMTVISGVLAVGVWFNPGEAAWIDPTVELQQGVSLLTYGEGPLYWVVVTYVFMLAVPATAMLASLALTGDDLYFGQAVSVVVGSLAPLVAGGASALNLTPVGLDVTPIGFAVTGVAFAYALVRHDFLTVVPATRRIGRDAVVRNMRDGVVVVDERDRVIDLNPVAESVLDGDRSALVDRPITDVPGVEADEDGWSGEVTTSDGRLFEVDTAPLFDRNDRRIGAVVTLRDVTELRTRQQRLTVLNRVLRHNLRNDMNTIDGYATMLADRFDAPPARQVRKVSAEVVDLADKAREIERVMARRGDTDPVAVDELVEPIAATVADRFDAAVSVDCACSTAVPGRGLLEPAVENVVENAAEHNDADDPAVEVGVSNGDDTVEIVVSDNGPGIPPQEREVLLEGTETALTHGSGLGLWLVYWAVESLDGEIAFEDNAPRGSVVTLRVPTAEAAAADAGPTPGAPDDADAAGSLSDATADD